MWYPVHNDFHVNGSIFSLFEGLKVEDMEKVLHNTGIDTPTNGHQSTNGDSVKTNGVISEASGENKSKPSLLNAAKSAAMEVTNGVKGMTLST